jgi:protein-tyrosine phosphatase/membrane-associated phospholipid phosphatase
MAKMAGMPRPNRIERSGSGRARSTKALGVSVGLGLLFLVVYGSCNWFTAHRSNVPTLFFEWERFIPFVPLMIVPYMSIDLFFVAAPFLCRNDRELATFARRMSMALLVAGLSFLLFPLRFAFGRPQVGGWLGGFFDWFRTLDQPYNLLPSLHIALCLIIAELYARHTRGLLRHALIFWFVLIGFSAVLTYQHHLMDVVAGFALGAYCLYFIRESAGPLPVIPNSRVGSYYLIGAFIAASLVVLCWPWGVVLIWPTVSLGIVTAAYFGVGPGIFRKRDGRVPWMTWWALGPCLLGQHLSRLYYRRECRAWNELTPRIWIGCALNRHEAAAAVRLGVTAVLDLTAEFSAPLPFRKLIYRNIQILDLTAPSLHQLHEIAAFIDEESRTGVVYIHCKIGYSRTAAAAAAWLLWSGEARTVSEAIGRLRQARPTIVVRLEVVAALTDFARHIPVSPRLDTANPHNRPRL